MGEVEVKAEANPKAKTFGRERLSPGAYTLDLSTVRHAPVKMNGQPSTFVEAYRKLRDSKIQEMPQFNSDKYITGEGEIHLECDWQLRSVLRTLTDLTRQGIDPHSIRWFYFDHDWSRDADVSSTFFAVRAGKLVLESCNFDSETPMILKREVDDDPIWHSQPSFDEAFERYWYRKFYTETLTGQLMVLRPDEPILYYFERPQTRDLVREVQLVTLMKIYRLLCIATLLLIAIAFPAIKDYLAILAALFGADFLWLCWTTRKVGRP